MTGADKSADLVLPLLPLMLRQETKGGAGGKAVEGGGKKGGRGGP